MRRLIWPILVVALLFRLLWLGSVPGLTTNHEATLAVTASELPFRGWHEGEEIVSPVPWFLAVASVKFFGLSVYSLRLPIILAAVIGVYLLYCITSRLFSKRVGLVSAALLAISPWHIHLSRFFIEEIILVTILLFFIWALIVHRKWLILISFSMLSFSSWHWIGRFMTALVPSFETWLLNITSYFSFDWLFFRGDKYFIHGTGDIGQFYLWLLPFLLIGLFTAAETIKGRLVVLSALAFLSIASLSKFSPEARASLPALPFLIVTIAVGIDSSIVWGWKLGRFKWFAYLVVACIALYQVLLYSHLYLVHFGKRSGSEWPAVYREVGPYITQVSNKYDEIVVTNKYGASREQLKLYTISRKESSKEEFAKIIFSVPDRIDTYPQKTLLLLEPELKPIRAIKIREFKVANQSPAIVAWETIP